MEFPRKKNPENSVKDFNFDYYLFKKFIFTIEL